MVFKGRFLCFNEIWLYFTCPFPIPSLFLNRERYLRVAFSAVGRRLGGWLSHFTHSYAFAGGSSLCWEPQCVQLFRSFFGRGSLMDALTAAFSLGLLSCQALLWARNGGFFYFVKRLHILRSNNFRLPMEMSEILAFLGLGSQKLTPAVPFFV